MKSIINESGSSVYDQEIIGKNPKWISKGSLFLVVFILVELLLFSRISYSPEELEANFILKVSATPTQTSTDSHKDLIMIKNNNDPVRKGDLVAILKTEQDTLQIFRILKKIESFKIHSMANLNNLVNSIYELKEPKGLKNILMEIENNMLLLRQIDEIPVYNKPLNLNTLNSNQFFFSKSTVDQNLLKNHLELVIEKLLSQVYDSLNHWKENHIFYAKEDGIIKYNLSSNFQNNSRLLFTILSPKNRIEAEVIIPTKIIPYVEIGQSCELVFNDFPNSQYGKIYGNISNLSNNDDINSLIVIELKDGLVTSNNLIIPFNDNLGGMVTIKFNEQKIVDKLLKKNYFKLF